MPALATVVSTYIDSITNSLKAGSDLGQNIHAAGRNYLKAQDLATTLELLQDATGKATIACAALGTTTTAIVTSVPANSYVGALVTFAANTTTVALRGVSARVLSHNTTTFTFASTLPAVTAIGDTFTIKHDFLDTAISAIREGKAKSEPVPGNIYSTNRLAIDALSKLLFKIGQNALPETTLTRSAAVTAAGSTDTTIVTADRFRIDEFKGLTLTVGSDVRVIVSNTENTITVSKALASAPGAGTSFSVKRLLQASPVTAASTHPGGHQDNVHLSNAIASCKTVVTNLVLPT